MSFTPWKHPEINRRKERKSIYYNFARFSDSIKQLITFFRAYLATLLKGLNFENNERKKKNKRRKTFIKL